MRLDGKKIRYPARERLLRTGDLVLPAPVSRGRDQAALPHTALGTALTTFKGHEYHAPFECRESFECMSDEELRSYAAIIAPSGMVPPALQRGPPPVAPGHRVPAAGIRRVRRHQGPIICQDMWLVAPAPELVRGRPVVCHNNLYSDVKNMGAIYTDEDVVVDRDLVTGRSGAHCHLFARKIIDLLAEC